MSNRRPSWWSTAAWTARLMSDAKKPARPRIEPWQVLDSKY